MSLDADPRRRLHGALYALAAYGSWGIVPVFWKKLRDVPPLELLAHRAVWSLVFVTLLLVVARRWGTVVAALRSRRTLGFLALTTALIAVNWGLFIWAVQAGKILQASLGYYVNPLVNVVAGVVVLGERLGRPQRIAVGLAAAGVVVLTLSTGTLPWIALLLAATFAAYGLLRKLAPVEALAGLFVETLLFAPLAFAYLALRETSGTGTLSTHGASHALLVALSGPITALPLLWFTAAARRLPLSTLGFFQYVSPTLQFLLAVLVYGERLTAAHVAAFACIWSALLVFTLGRTNAPSAPAARDAASLPPLRRSQ